MKIYATGGVIFQLFYLEIPPSWLIFSISKSRLCSNKFFLPTRPFRNGP